MHLARITRVAEMMQATGQEAWAALDEIALTGSKVYRYRHESQSGNDYAINVVEQEDGSVVYRAYWGRWPDIDRVDLGDYKVAVLAAIACERHGIQARLEELRADEEWYNELYAHVLAR